VNDQPPIDPVEDIDRALLGSDAAYTRVEVASRAGVPLEVAEQLWQQLGFPRTGDDDIAFTDADVEALRRADDLISKGILTAESQAALVRTWGRSFARLSEWQVSLLAGRALEGDDPRQRLDELMDDVVPQVEALQSYVWRRHLASAANRLLGEADLEGTGTRSSLAVAFVDIVGYTGHSKNLTDSELVDWVEYFEDEATRVVVELDGRVIKTIGDEILFVTDDPRAAAEVTLGLTARGSDEDDEFPAVRAGAAYGEVVSRLGDVFGPTVNIASRLTSIARPGTVLVDRGLHEVLSGPLAEDDTETSEMTALDPPAAFGRIIDRAAGELADLSPYSQAGGYRFRRLPRRSVKGYSKLEPFVLRRAKER
jgi:adenylate cyclase